jgi:hypothetical protein
MIGRFRLRWRKDGASLSLRFGPANPRSCTWSRMPYGLACSESVTTTAASPTWPI